MWNSRASHWGRCVVWLAWGWGGAGGCVSLPEFDPAQEVLGPRVLAVVAEPPEARLGEDVRLSLLVAEADVEAVHWRLCPGFYTFGGGNQYDEGLQEEGTCAGGMSIALPDGQTTTLSATRTASVFEGDRERWQEAILGVSLPTATAAAVERQLAEVGIPLLVEVTVETSSKTLRASKRVLLTTRAETHTNPPPPWLMLGEQEVVHHDGFHCAARDGSVLRLPAGEELEVEPRFIGVEEPWLEDYQVLDAQGRTAERSEAAYYVFYSTSGGFSQRVTRGPLRNNVFQVPQSGCHTMWVVVQDGHGGTSACGVSFVAGETERCEALVQPDAGSGPLPGPGVVSADGGAVLTTATDAGVEADAGADIEP